MKNTGLNLYFQMKLQNSVGESVPKTKNMTADSQKKSHHHHHHHHQHPHKKMVQIKTLERITNLPVVESAHAYYEKIKNSNTLIKWSLMPAETGVWLAVGTAMPVVSYFEKPVSAVDSIFCMGLDVLEANLPMIKYPPDLVYNITKDYVTSKVVTPVMKRADSVKQLSINGANNFGELAANRLNNAIDVADKYVDKYLPDISDAPDSTTDGPNPVSNPHPNSKRSKTIQHVNQFSRKLQRRLTRRTIAEARALKQQGADTLRSFVYLVNLLASDPKQFMEKARAMWLELSKDEPENQVPPANLEQLIEMLMREFARRVVHLTNYSYAKMIVLTHHGMETAHMAACAAIYWANQVIKAMHLEPAIEKTITQVVRAHHACIEFVEKLVELIRNLKMEGLKVAEKRAILPSEQPPQPSQSTDSMTPQRTSSISSVSSVTSSVSTASFNTITPSKSPHPSLNGETYTVYESKHEQVVS